jgi:ribonuclease P protein component
MRPPLGIHPRARLVSERDYQRAYKTGSRARASTLVVVVAENGLAYTRAGLSVGKKVWKQAVRRNRVRRVFREAFRLSYAELPVGVDLVLIPAEPRLVPRLDVTRKELVHLAHKAHRRFLERQAEAGPT